MQHGYLDAEDALALRAVKGRLAHLKWLTAAVELAMNRHLRALKYSPDQPRVPRGNSDGGQWTDTGANGNPIGRSRTRLAGDVPTNDPEKPPKERPKTSTERAGWLKAAARMAAEHGVVAAEVAKLYPWMTYYTSGMQSYTRRALWRNCNRRPRAQDMINTTLSNRARRRARGTPAKRSTVLTIWS
jgi:hypothetical protein